MKITRWTAVLLVTVGAASYGMLSSFIKLAFEEGWNNIQITSVQMAMGTVLLWMLAAIRPRAWSNPFRGPWLQLVVIGVLGLSLTTIFYNIALSLMDASLAIVLLFQFTWMTVVLESILKRRRPGAAQLVSIALIMVGTVLAVDLISGTSKAWSWGGLVMGLLSAVTYSIFITMTGYIRSDMDSVLKSAVMQTAAMLLVFVIFPPVNLIEVGSPSLWLWGILLGLVGQVVPTVAFNAGIPKIGSSLAAVLGSMELPVAVVSAFFILEESVNGVQWLGIGCIICGIIAAQLKVHQRAPR